MKNWKLLISTMAILMFVISCGKQTAPSVSPQETKALTSASESTNRMGLENNDAEINISNEAESGPSVDLTTPVPTVVMEAPAMSNDIALTDWDTYMIVPGDFLIKIANKQYGNFRRWREIYSWNSEDIGDDPNLIYPYHYLTLKRDNMVEKFKPGFSEYEVNSGETLWDIAGKLYGDPVAWIILYLDNADRLNGNSNSLDPGMRLQIRDRIDPKA